MRKILTGMVVFMIAVVASHSVFAAVASTNSSVDAQVSWRTERFLELSIHQSSDSAFDFGTIEAGVDEIEKKNAIRLWLRSNTRWALTYEKNGEGAEYLTVTPTQTSGRMNQTIPVDYKLSNLLELNPGDYTVTVTFTATTQ